MQKLKELFITLADFIQGLSNTTIGIIMGVIFALAFYNFALFVKANKGDKTKFNALGTFCTFLLLVGVAVLITLCLRY